MRIQRIVALLLLVGIVLGYLVAPAITIGDKKPDPRLQAFPEDPAWYQCSDLQKVLSADKSFEVMSIVGSPTILRDVQDPQKTLYIAIGPEEQYRPAEKDIIKDFVLKGGKVIMADDYGFADDFSNGYGVNFYGQQMWDEKFLVNSTFPVVPAKLNLDPYLLVFSEPTGLANQSYEDPAKGEFTYSILANGSEKSYVDRNNNHIIDPEDAHGFVPMVMMVQYNTKVNHAATPGGKIVFVADTGPFTNDGFINMETLKQRIAKDPYFGVRTGFNMTSWKGTNREFVTALINNILPAGGKVIFDESRHPQSGYKAAVYDSITSVTIVTSNPLEAGLLSVGLLLVLFVVVIRAKDKESWIHRFDISSIHRRAMLPDTRAVQVDHLKKALLQKVRMLQSLSHDELRALTPVQIAQMIKDHDLNELLLNEAKTYSPDEIRALTAKLRAWGRA